MKKILFPALPLLLMIAVSCGKNRGEMLPENDIIEFKDPNFLKVLLTYDCAYGDDSEQTICIDADNDGKISFSEAKKVKMLVLTDLEDETAESYNIADISEIRYFTELAALYCDDNKLTSLDVSNNTALEVLGLNDNQLTSLDVGNNAGLVVLNCDRNRLVSIDVSKNTALKALSLGSNQLASVDVSSNAALEFLFLKGNQLTSIDVSNNAGLKVLGCGRNHLATLDLSKNTSLTDVYCEGNELKKIIIPAENSLDKFLLQSIKNEYGDDVIEYR